MPVLHGKLLRSEHHHARILSMDTSEAEAMEGVVAVVTADDIPGTPFLPNCQPQVYVFPRDRIVKLGQMFDLALATNDSKRKSGRSVRAPWSIAAQGRE